MVNETITPNKMSLDEAVVATMEHYRSNVKNDELFAKWIYGQANIPYHQFSKLALDQRERMKKRVKRLSMLESLSEAIFSEALKKATKNFFDANKLLYYETKLYFQM